MKCRPQTSPCSSSCWFNDARNPLLTPGISASFDLLEVALELRHCAASSTAICDLFLTALLTLVFRQDYRDDLGALPHSLSTLGMALNAHLPVASNSIIIDLFYLLMPSFDRFEAASYQGLCRFAAGPACARLPHDQRVRVLILCAEMASQHGKPFFGRANAQSRQPCLSPARAHPSISSLQPFHPSPMPKDRSSTLSVSCTITRPVSSRTSIAASAPTKI
jgi:hypothetical protein